MAKNHIQPGKVISFTAAATVTSGDLIKIGDLAAVALGDVANGAVGQAQIDEVFRVPKLTTDVMAAGVIVYLDADDKRVTLDAASGANIRAGKTVEAAGNGVTTVAVKLNV